MHSISFYISVLLLLLSSIPIKDRHSISFRDLPPIHWNTKFSYLTSLTRIVSGSIAKLVSQDGFNFQRAGFLLNNRQLEKGPT